MNTVRLSNLLFHVSDQNGSTFLQLLDELRGQKMSVSNRQILRKNTKEVLRCFDLFQEGKNDIVNEYGVEEFDDNGISKGKFLKEDNVEGYAAYRELLKLSNPVDIEIIDINSEPDVRLSDKEYDALVFMFEEMPKPVPPEAKPEETEEVKEETAEEEKTDAV